MTDFKNYTVDSFRKEHKNYKLSDVEQRRLKLATTQASATLQAYAALIKSFDEQVQVEKPDYRKLFMTGENLDKPSFIFDIKNFEADLKTYATNYFEKTDREFKEDNKEKTEVVMKYLNNEDGASLEDKINLFVQMTKDMASFMVGRDNINKVVFPAKYAKDDKNFYLGDLKLSGFFNSYSNFMGGAKETTTKKVFRQLAKEASLIYSYNDKKMDYQYELSGSTLNYQKLDSAGDAIDEFGMITSGVDKIMIQSKSGKALDIELPEGATMSRKALERGVLYDIKEENGKTFMVVGDSLQPVSESNLYYVIEGTPNFSVDSKDASDIKIVEYMNDGSIYSQVNSGLRGDDLLTNVLGNSNTFEESMIDRLSEIGFQEFLFADHRENLDDVETVGAILDGVSEDNTDKFAVTIGGVEGLTKNHIGSYAPPLLIKKSFMNSLGGVNERNPKLDPEAPFWHTTKDSIDVANTVRAFLQIEPEKLAANNISEIVEKTQASVSLGSKIAFENAINYFPDIEVSEDSDSAEVSTADWQSKISDRSFLKDMEGNKNYTALAHKYFSCRIGEVVEAYREFAKEWYTRGKAPDAEFSLESIQEEIDKEIDKEIEEIDKSLLSSEDKDKAKKAKEEGRGKFKASFEKLQNAFISVSEQKALSKFKNDPLFKADIFSTEDSGRKPIDTLLSSLGDMVNTLAEGKSVSKVFGNSSPLFVTNFIKYGGFSPLLSSADNSEIEALYNEGLDTPKTTKKAKAGKEQEKESVKKTNTGAIKAANDLKFALLALVSKINMAEQLGTPEDNKNITAGVKKKLINLLTNISNEKTKSSFLDSIDTGFSSLQERGTAMFIEQFKKLSTELDSVRTSGEVALKKSVDPLRKLDLSANPEFAVTALGLKKGDPMITFVVATGGVGKTELAKTLKLLNAIEVVGIENRDQYDPLNVKKMVGVSITDGKRMYKIHDMIYKSALGGIVAGKGIAVVDELVETISQWLGSQEVGTGPKVDAMNKASGREAMFGIDIAGIRNEYFNNGMIAIGNYLNELDNDAAINRRSDTLLAGIQNQDYYTKEGVLKMMKASLLRPIADNISEAASKEIVSRTMANKEERIERLMSEFYPSMKDSELRSLTSILKKAINDASKTQAIDATGIFLRNEGDTAAQRVISERNNIITAGTLVLNELYKNQTNASSEVRENINKVASLVGKMLQDDAGKQDLKSFMTTTLTENIYSNAVAKRIYNSSYSNPLDEVAQVSEKYMKALTSEKGQEKREKTINDLMATMKSDAEFKKFIDTNVGDLKVEKALTDVASKVKSRTEALIEEMDKVEQNITEKTGENSALYYATSLLNSQLSEVIGIGNELTLYDNVITNLTSEGQTKFDAQLELAAEYMARYNALSKAYLDEDRSKPINREKAYNPDAYPITPWPSLARLASELAKNPNMSIEPNTVMDSLMRCAPNDDATPELKSVLEDTVKAWSNKHNANIQKVKFAQADMK